MYVQQKANTWWPGIGGGKEMRNGCLMGMGFPLRVMKMFLELGPLSRRGGGLWLSLESPQGIWSSLHLVR